MGLSSQSLLWFLQLVLIFYCQFSGSSSPQSFVPPQCHPDESSALLRFKRSFAISSSSRRCAVSSRSSFGITTWNESTNCCIWSGIGCDGDTGHVIGLNLFCGVLHGTISSNSSLFFLRHLRSLDLSFNDFKGSGIVPEFGQFKNMTHLDLSHSNLGGYVPPEIAHLIKLASLRIGPSEDYEIAMGAASLQSLSRNLSVIEELDMAGINMSLVPVVLLTNLSSSLMSLALGSCRLQGSLPTSFFQFPNLRIIDLSGNKLSGYIPWASLNLEQINSLDMSDNYFSGEIPALSGNSTMNFSSRSPNFTFLSLSNNLIYGSIPLWIYTLQYLEFLDLGNNLLTGEIDDFQSTSLSYLHLKHNKLHGIIPRSIFRNVELTWLDLSSNSLTGDLKLDYLSNTSNLGYLDLSFNNLSLNFKTSRNLSCDNLSYLSLSSCNVTEFPYFLRSSKKLQFLVLSRNRISGIVPKWLWDVSKKSLVYLDLSHNLLTKMDPLPWNKLAYLDLRSNSLLGPPSVPTGTRLRAFQVSNNHLFGEISTSLCNMTSLQVLDLSFNNLSGAIPQCFQNFSNTLMVFDLRRNNFHGRIRLAFAKGSSLRTLNLNGNQFEGSLPGSLLNCEYLQVLDVGNNKINGTFPQWLQSLQELQVLILRSNRFDGLIRDPKTTSPFRMLRIMDVSGNKFTGRLPSKYFENFEAMIDARSDGLKYVGDYSFSEGLEYYEDSVGLVLKGSELELEKILTVLTIIDFSRNGFTGEIPEVIGILNSLKGLNFSHNKLSGAIPTSFGNLSNLEGLDLSSNKLVGKIPWQLASDLNQLQILNLSMNDLEGPIPRGPQFDTFEEDSFGGNSQLCGFPLSKQCGDEAKRAEDYDDDNGISLDRTVVMMGYAGGLVIGISLGYIALFSRSFDIWFMKRSRLARLRGRRR